MRRGDSPAGSDMDVLEEHPAHFAAITCVHDCAFGGPQEGMLVAMLRDAGRVDLSLVAVIQGEVAGHALFSRVTLEPVTDGVQWVALGPIGVLPELQGLGIGTRLVTEGLERCRIRGYDGVVLLGDPGYYSRFGFVPARDYNLTSDYGDGPEFQAHLLHPCAALPSLRKVIYPSEFAAAAPD